MQTRTNGTFYFINAIEGRGGRRIFTEAVGGRVRRGGGHTGLGGGAVKERFLSEMVFPGEVWVVPVARRFVGTVLPAAGYGDVDNARLVVSELISNAIQHTSSGRDGGVVAVEVVGVDVALARIEVTDDGADTVPRPYMSDGMDCGGRGLLLVAQVSAAWGVRPLGGRQRAVWAEIPTALSASCLCQDNATNYAFTEHTDLHWANPTSPRL
jgi:anti-sigma regulatory factor (Ser/Thr protein kinase)